LQYDFAESKGLKTQMASALNSQGLSWLVRGEYPNALNYFLPGVKIDEELGNKENLATSLVQLGQAYAQLGAYSNALDQWQRALKLWEELGDNQGIIARTVVNAISLNLKLNKTRKTCHSYTWQLLLLHCFHAPILAPSSFKMKHMQPLREAPSEWAVIMEIITTKPFIL
jgi:tetratricopeptide (TPR) repeat protein